MNEKQNFNSNGSWREANQLVRTFVTALEYADHVRLLLIFGTHRFHVASHRFYVFGADIDTQKQQEGLIRFFGFSHDEFEELLENYKVENKSEAKHYYNGGLFIF
jgi:predicted aldo/keto reductase-like oxidoreductase